MLLWISVADTQYFYFTVLHKTLLLFNFLSTHLPVPLLPLLILTFIPKNPLLDFLLFVGHPLLHEPPIIPPTAYAHSPGNQPHEAQNFCQHRVNLLETSLIFFRGVGATELNLHVPVTGVLRVVEERFVHVGVEPGCGCG